MHERCSECNLKYERAPGYFLGSAYINYGLTAIIITASYIGFHFIGRVPNGQLAPWLVGFCVLFPLSFFRFARGLWLSMDCYFDAPGFEKDDSHE